MDSSRYQTGGALQLILLGVFLLIAILFLLTEQNILRTIRTENRKISPGLVWLQLIPVFGQIWQFVVVIRIAGSILKEIASWENDSILGAEASAIALGSHRPTLGIGITYCILHVLYIASLFLTDRSVLFGLIGIASVVCWVAYWVTLSGSKRKLRQKNLATL